MISCCFTKFWGGASVIIVVTKVNVYVGIGLENCWKWCLRPSQYPQLRGFTVGPGSAVHIVQLCSLPPTLFSGDYPLTSQDQHISKRPAPKEYISSNCVWAVVAGCLPLVGIQTIFRPCSMGIAHYSRWQLIIFQYWEPCYAWNLNST